jgi:uncharacterized damage-inducible protein DinB
MKQHFITLARANQWANRILYAELEKLTAAQLAEQSQVNFGSILGIANHTVLADRIWLQRFGFPGEMAAAVDATPWPDLPSLRAAREAEDVRVIAFAEGLDTARMDFILRYTTTRGEARAMAFDMCLAHFYNHQTFHRGQIHALLGVHGVKARDVDLLFYMAEQGGAGA